MRVRELIEKLQEMDQEALVVVWDCSWEGQLDEVEMVYFSEDEGVVRLE